MANEFVVVKLGGSLLDLPDLANRLRWWLANQYQSQSIVVVVGGGAGVEQLRRKNRRASVDQERAHWQAIALMSQNAQRIATLVPEFNLTTDFNVLTNHAVNVSPSFFDCQDFLKHAEPHAPGIRLPCNWSVTSDSIAARLGVVLAAQEIVLLKSRKPIPNVSLQHWAAMGYVDAFLPRLQNDLPPLRAIDFRGGRGSIRPS